MDICYCEQHRGQSTTLPLAVYVHLAAVLSHVLGVYLVCAIAFIQVRPTERRTDPQCFSQLGVRL